MGLVILVQHSDSQTIVLSPMGSPSSEHLLELPIMARRGGIYL
jgi:hypothetical protein